VYLSKKALMAILLAHRRQRAMEAMADLNAEIAAEEAVERKCRATCGGANAGCRHQLIDHAD
jgi:hypothetical protein